MPKPPILSAIDWKTHFQSGRSYNDWLKEGEVDENCQKIEDIRSGFGLDLQICSYLKAVNRPVHIFVIAEDWCGDVVRHVPILQKMVEAANNLNVKYITREDSPEVFVRYLTNGGEAIPKFIFLNHEFVECGNWGPMPADARELIARGKACGDVKTARKKVAALYEADNTCRTVVKELLNLIDIATTVKV